MSSFETVDEYLTPGQAAAMLQVSRQTVSRWADAGLLPCIVTLGGHRRFDREVVLGAAAHMGIHSSAAGDGDAHR
jgi:excisionase family DNA binding protein